MSNLSDNIKRRMTELKISQTALAQRVNITPAAISRYLSGERIPNALTLARIAGELSVTMEDLTGVAPKTQPSEVEEAVRLVARSAHELSDAQKQTIISALLSLGSQNDK